MKTIIMYYTLGGTSKKQAEEIANNLEEAVLCQVNELKKRNIFSAFIPGCPNAMKRKASKIEEIKDSLEEFDKIILVAPVWAGYPAPAFNAMVQRLPKDKDVEIFLCSGGGETPKSKEGTCQMITDRGCRMVLYHDIKTA